MLCHAKPMLPRIGLPWQHSNASQSGQVFVPRKAVLTWHRHVMDMDVKFNTGVPASAACERLFSVGKDVFSAKWNRLPLRDCLCVMSKSDSALASSSSD